jgi:hypothetical protein
MPGVLMGILFQNMGGKVRGASKSLPSHSVAVYASVMMVQKARLVVDPSLQLHALTQSHVSQQLLTSLLDQPRLESTSSL